MSESLPQKTINLTNIKYIRGHYIHAHKGRGRRRGHPKPYRTPQKIRQRWERVLNELHEMLDQTMAIELETSNHIHRLGGFYY